MKPHASKYIRNRHRKSGSTLSLKAWVETITDDVERRAAVQWAKNKANR